MHYPQSMTKIISMTSVPSRCVPQTRHLVAVRASIVLCVAWAGACAPSPEAPPAGESWCGLADDLPCCKGTSGGVPPAERSAVVTIAPVPEAVRAADDLTRAFVETGATDVTAVWRGVTESGDAERPSRVTLEVPAVGTLRFDFARSVADFPTVADGAELTVTATSAERRGTNPNGAAVRLARADASLLAAVAGCTSAVEVVQLSPTLAPFAGQAGDEACREPTPLWPAGNSTWCYVGRTDRELVLDGIASPIAAGETARVSVGAAMYDFTNHRFAVQDLGGPHTTTGCLPALLPLCAFSAYSVAAP